jgi:DNA-binding IclR family transcriptional regulator
MHDIEQLHHNILGTAQRVTNNLRAVAGLCTTEPAFTAHMVEQTGVPVSTAYNIVKRLVDAGILRKEQKICGQSVWSVTDLTEALDAFAQRAGNRTPLHASSSPHAR